MSELQRLETSIDQEIVRELIELTPEDWHAILFEVEITVDRETETYRHEISSPEGRKEPITPSHELFDATYRLRQLFGRFGRTWKKATYRVEQRRDNSWGYVVDFEY